MATPQTLDTVGNIPAGLTGYFRSAVDAVSNLGTHAQQALSSPEALAAMAKHMPLNQFLNTIDKHSPEFSSATEVMRENPQLGNAFHNAFVNNEEFRNRLMNPPAGDANALSAQNIGAILTDEKYGSQAQTLMTGMLQKVSRGEMRIEQVEQIAGAGVNMMSVGNDKNATKEQRAEAQQKFIETLEQNGLPTGQIKGEQIFAYLREVMNGDPKSASANFVNALGLSGEQAAAMQELLTMAGGLLKFLGKPYVDFVNKHGPGITHDVTDMYERLSGERDISISAQRAKLSPAQREQQERKNPTLGQKEAEEAGAKGKDLDGNEIKVSSYDDRGIAQKPFENASLGVSGHVAQTPAWAQHANNTNTFRPQQFGVVG